MPTNWRVYGKDTVAARLSKADLPGFFSKKLTVGPNEAAIVVRNGKAEEAITEQKAKVAGAFDAFRRVFGGGSDLDIYFVDLTPFSFSVYLGASTKQEVTKSGTATTSAHKSGASNTADIISASRRAGWASGTEDQSSTSATEASRLDVSQVCVQAISLDHEVIPAECLFRVSVDIEEVAPFFGLMRGKEALATWDIAALVRDELVAKVLIPQIASHRADELRGNRALLQQMEADAQAQLLRTFTSCGMSLESFTISWGLTEQEVLEISRKRQEREEEALKFTHQRRLAEMQREVEIQRTRLTNLQELKVAETQGQEELKNLLVNGDVGRELLVEGKRVDIAKLDAEVAKIQLDLQGREGELKVQQQRAEGMLRLDLQRAGEVQRLDVADREWRVENEKRLAALDADDKEMASMVRMQIQMATAKHEREMAGRRMEIDSDFQKRKIALEESLARMAMMERLVSQGLSTGAADASVLKTMLEQSTEQEYAKTSEEKVKARAEAAKAGKSMEAYQSAEDRERAHQRDMTRLSSEMMQSAKQTPASPFGAAAAPGSAASPFVAGAAMAQCPHCNSPVQIGWKACPQCGTKLATRCPACGKDTQPTWKACPACGQALS